MADDCERRRPSANSSEGVAGTSLWNPQIPEDAVTINPPIQILVSTNDVGEEDDAEANHPSTNHESNTHAKPFYRNCFSFQMFQRSSAAEIDVPVDPEFCSCLQYYLNKMFYMGMCPQKPKQNSVGNHYKKIQTVLHISFLLLSIIQVPFNLKYFTFLFMKESSQSKHKLEQFIQLAFRSAQGFTQIYFTYFVTFQWKQLVGFLDEMTVMKAGPSETLALNKKNSRIGALLAVVTLTFTIGNVVFATDGAYWPPKGIIQFYSFIAAEDMFYWTPHDNGTTQETLMQTYGTAWSVEIFLLGTFRMLVNYCGWVRDHMLQDIVILLALTLYQVVTTLTRLLEESTGTNSNHTFEYKWNVYKQVRKVTANINKSYRATFCLMHVIMVLLACHFLLQVLQPETITVHWYMLMYNIAKALLIYYLAATISDKNKIIQDWIHSFCSVQQEGFVVLNGDRINVFYLFHEVHMNSVGLGQNEFFIDQGFIIKGFTTVAGLFLLMADFRY